MTIINNNMCILCTQVYMYICTSWTIRYKSIISLCINNSCELVYISLTLHFETSIHLNMFHMCIAFCICFCLIFFYLIFLLLLLLVLYYFIVIFCYKTDFSAFYIAIAIVMWKVMCNITILFIYYITLNSSNFYV